VLIHKSLGRRQYVVLKTYMCRLLPNSHLWGIMFEFQLEVYKTFAIMHFFRMPCHLKLNYLSAC